MKTNLMLFIMAASAPLFAHADVDAPSAVIWTKSEVRTNVDEICGEATGVSEIPLVAIARTDNGDTSVFKNLRSSAELIQGPCAADARAGHCNIHAVLPLGSVLQTGRASGQFRHVQVVGLGPHNEYHGDVKAAGHVVNLAEQNAVGYVAQDSLKDLRGYHLLLSNNSFIENLRSSGVDLRNSEVRLEKMADGKIKTRSCFIDKNKKVKKTFAVFRTDIQEILVDPHSPEIFNGAAAVESNEVQSPEVAKPAPTVVQNAALAVNAEPQTPVEFKVVKESAPEKIVCMKEGGLILRDEKLKSTDHLIAAGTAVRIDATAKPLPKDGNLFAKISLVVKGKTLAGRASLAFLKTKEECGQEQTAKAPALEKKDEKKTASAPLIRGSHKEPLQIHISRNKKLLTVLVDGIVKFRWPCTVGLKGLGLTRAFVGHPYDTEFRHPDQQFPGAVLPYVVKVIGGQFIHGTQANYFLGKAHSHGCIRLAINNAKTVYELVKKYGLKNTWIQID